MEVLIALMIVGILGVAIAGGLVVVRSTSDRTEAKAEVLRQLNDAAVDVSNQVYFPCTAATPQPYSTPSVLNPTISVSVMNSSGAWVPCGSPGTSGASVQQVKLTATFQDKTYERVIMKVQ